VTLQGKTTVHVFQEYKNHPTNRCQIHVINTSVWILLLFSFFFLQGKKKKRGHLYQS